MVCSRLLVAFAVLLSVGACSKSEKDMGFKSSQQEVMREMKAALTKSGIQYHVDADGFIRFRGNDQEAVMRIRGDVEQLVADGQAIRYDKASAAYLKSLLSSEGLKFSVEVRDDGEWIRWHAQNLQQQAEIDMKVAQYTISMRGEKNTAESGEEKTPLKK